MATLEKPPDPEDVGLDGLLAVSKCARTLGKPGDDHLTARTISQIERAIMDDAHSSGWIMLLRSSA